MLRKFSCILLCSIVLSTLASCDISTEIDTDDFSRRRLRFSSFGFSTEENKDLTSDYMLTNTDCDTLSFFIHELNDVSSLIPRYTGDFIIVKSLGSVVESGYTTQDYSSIVKYDLEDRSGHIDSCFVKVIYSNGIPIIDIVTEGNAEIVSKEEYINAKIRVSNCPEYGFIDSKCTIKGRGNSTWTDYPKKPYKIKLSNKSSIFGFPGNKDWVLLADYTDKSLLRTAYMSAISRAVEMEYTVNYKHVDLVLNGNKLGTYILSDQVEKSSNRVAVDDTGFFIEDDRYYFREPLHFTSISGNRFTFKYPKPDKGNIKEGDDNFVFISTFINTLEQSLSLIANEDYSYRNYIDLDSFAKWYVVSEVMGNWEPNIYYALKNREAKLKAYPMWDAEWSMGLAMQGDISTVWYFPPTLVDNTLAIWKNRKYFDYLFRDPLFVKCVKENFSLLKNKRNDIREEIDTLVPLLEYTQIDNFDIWPVLDKFLGAGLIALGSWKSEVDYVNGFFDIRMEWLEKELSELQ